VVSDELDADDAEDRQPRGPEPRVAVEERRGALVEIAGQLLVRRGRRGFVASAGGRVLCVPGLLVATAVAVVGAAVASRTVIDAAAKSRLDFMRTPWNQGASSRALATSGGSGRILRRSRCPE
jgi:hypothetical protein